MRDRHQRAIAVPAHCTPSRVLRRPRLRSKYHADLVANPRGLYPMSRKTSSPRLVSGPRHQQRSISEVISIPGRRSCNPGAAECNWHKQDGLRRTRQRHGQRLSSKLSHKSLHRGLDYSRGLCVGDKSCIPSFVSVPIDLCHENELARSCSMKSVRLMLCSTRQVQPRTNPGLYVSGRCK